MTEPLLPVSVADLAGLDLTALLPGQDPAAVLGSVLRRAEARVASFTPITVAERLQFYRAIGFRPHGLYVPDDPNLARTLRARLQSLGALTDVDARLAAYHALQIETGRYDEEGLPGHWTGQQAVARSAARFRFVAWGRRGGKSLYASREAACVLLQRPRAVVWIVAPVMRSVGRVFDMILQLLDDLGVPIDTRRNSGDEKLVILANGSRVEGVSGDRPSSAAGTGVDFVIGDEAHGFTYELWARAILPPTLDNSGDVLCISSWEGEESFWAAEADQAKARAQTDPNWDFFEDASYEVNIHVFPQGRNTPALTQVEATTSPEDFLEQYGAVRQGSRNLVYPQFKDVVHVGDYPFDPEHPVILCGDPSYGANEYALIALQDYGDDINVIDEIYYAGVNVEDLIPILDAKPWRNHIAEMVMDSAAPSEIERWNRLVQEAPPGLTRFFIFGVPDKMELGEAGFPIYRNLLRDPARFHLFREAIVEEILMDWGLDRLDLTPFVEQRINLEIAERLARPRPEDIRILRDCAHIHFDRTNCPHTIEEHKHYQFRKPTRANLNLLEKPRKFRDHAMDALRYFAMTYKRYYWDLATEVSPRDMLVTDGPSGVRRPGATAEADESEAPARPVIPGWLAQVRMRHAEPAGDFSYLREY